MGKITIGAGNNTRRNTTDSTEREQAQVYLNIGFMSKNAEGEDEFISLPVGVGLDTMKPINVSGSNEEWKQLAQAKNALMEQLQKAAEQMEPGEEHVIADLQIQIRRRNVSEQPDAGDNPHMQAMAKLGFMQAS
jgi:HAMP domain-containing protein